jgi:hypothetical protein
VRMDETPHGTITVKASRTLVEQLKPIALANRRSTAQELNVAIEEHIRTSAQPPPIPKKT